MAPIVGRGGNCNLDKRDNLFSKKLTINPWKWDNECLSQDLAAFWEILEADVAKFVGLELKRMEKGQRQRTAENLTACLDGMMWEAANQVRMNNYKTHQSSWCKGSFIILC